MRPLLSVLACGCDGIVTWKVSRNKPLSPPNCVLLALGVFYRRVVRVKDPLGRQWVLGFGINTGLHLFGASSLKEASYKETVELMVAGYIQSRKRSYTETPRKI